MNKKIRTIKIDVTSTRVDVDNKIKIRGIITLTNEKGDKASWYYTLNNPYNEKI